VNILQLDKNSEDETRKLFRYIDYDNNGYVSKQLIRLFLAFIEGEFGSAGSLILEVNPIFKCLKKFSYSTQQGDLKLDESRFA
jgi:Ca2+-binding EF-hand superfamily protein